MNKLAGWIIGNARNFPSRAGLEEEVPFAIWQRQWEVFDLTGDRQGSGRIAEKTESLSRHNDHYRLMTAIYKSQVQIYQGDYAGALVTAQGFLKTAPGETSPKQLALIYAQIGQAYQNLSDFEKSIAYRKKAMDIFRQTGDTDSYGNGLASLGMVNWKIGDYPKAMEFLEKAREMFEASGNQRSLATTITNIANVMLATDQVEKARQQYVSTLGICRKIGDVAKQSAILNNLGSIFYRQGDYIKALEHYQVGYRLDLQLGNVTGQAAKLANMAVLLASLGRHQESLEKFTQALKLDNASGNLEGQMKKLGNIASLYGLIGDFEKAMDCVDRAVDICRKINAQGYLGHCLGMRASFLTALKRYQEAEVSALDSLEMSRGSGNLSQLANTHNYLAEIYWNGKNFSQALEHSLQSMKLMENHQLFEIYRENIYYSHSKVLQSTGQTGPARKFLNDAYHEVMKRVESLPQGVSPDDFIRKNETLQNIVREWKESREQE